jgi:DNA-binding SARP family transcriptional activator
MVGKCSGARVSEIGRVIARLRHASGLTQGQLADAASLSLGLIRDLEQGRTHSPRWGSVEALAMALALGERDRAQLAAAWDGGNGTGGGRRCSLLNEQSSEAQAVVGIRLLGPLGADRAAGSLIDLGPVRRKAVLALVALRGDSGARLSELTDLLWPDHPPISASGIIQRHISLLRQLLDGTPGHRLTHQLIEWTGVSYRLQPGAYCHLDTADFVGFASNGDKAAADGEPDRACGFYERALQLWRGQCVADIDCLQQHPLVVALNRLRSDVVIRHADAALLAGDHARALPHLREACQAEPLCEILHARLIAALGSTGRRADAFAVFEQLRDRLDKELGIGLSDLVWRAYGRAIDA